MDHYYLHHPTLGDCGHKHETLSGAIVCLKSRKKAVAHCSSCGETWLVPKNTRYWSKDCKFTGAKSDCNGVDTVKATRIDQNLHAIRVALGGDPETWRTLTPDEWLTLGKLSGLFK